MKYHTYVLVLIALTMSACDPVSVMMGGTAVVGSMATREKGIKGTTSDTWISTQIKNKFYSFSPDLHASIGVNVQGGEVLLTGSVADESWIQEAERMSREVEGVTQIFNHVGVNKDGIAIGEVTSDSMITTQIKGHLLCDGDIRSLNYSVKTISGVVYVMGIARSEEELEKVLNYARNVKNVAKVVSYVKVNSNTEPIETNTQKADTT